MSNLTKTITRAELAQHIVFFMNGEAAEYYMLTTMCIHKIAEADLYVIIGSDTTSKNIEDHTSEFPDHIHSVEYIKELLFASNCYQAIALCGMFASLNNELEMSEKYGTMILRTQKIKLYKSLADFICNTLDNATITLDNGQLIQSIIDKYIQLTRGFVPTKNNTILTIV